MKKTALVTGGDRGIGRAIAIKLASMGNYVIINYRKREEKARETLEILKTNGWDGEVVKADISNKADVENMARKIKESVDGVDILVNNAGVGFASRFIDIDYDSWQRQIQTNLTGSFYTTKLLVRNMIKKRWGRIIFISSIAGIHGVMFLSAYSASKAGIIGLAKSLAIELAEFSITVNVVAPGFVGTKLGSSYFGWLESIGYKKPLESYLSYVPSHRLAEEEEIANIVGFLSSNEGSGITGQVIAVDAGSSLISGFVKK